MYLRPQYPTKILFKNDRNSPGYSDRWDGYALSVGQHYDEFKEKSLSYTNVNAVLGPKGDIVIPYIRSCYIIPESNLIICSRFNDDTNEMRAVFNKYGSRLTDWYEDINCNNTYLRNEPWGKASKGFFDRMVIECKNPCNNSGKVLDGKDLYGVVSNGNGVKKIDLKDLNGTNFIIKRDKLSNFLFIRSEDDSFGYVLHGDYDLLGDGIKYDHISYGFSPYGTFTLITNKTTKSYVEGVVVEFDTEKIYPSSPAKLVYTSSKQEAPRAHYIFADTGKMRYVYFLEPKNGFSLDGESMREIYQGKGEIFEDPNNAFLYCIYENDKIYIIVDDELVPCDEYRLSGEENTSEIIGPLGTNNILYLINDGKIKMHTFTNKRYYPLILEDEFDKVFCLDNKVNIIEKDGKETFVYDRDGIMFTNDSKDFTVEKTISSKDVIWFDECYPDEYDRNSDGEIEVKARIGEKDVTLKYDSRIRAVKWCPALQ